jgi:Bacterial SH3 domain
MKFRALTVAAAAALAALTAPQIAAAASGTVTAAALNLRSCASLNCATVATMPRGARVSIDAATGAWYHLTYNGVAGYASSRYVSTGAEITVTYARTTPVSPEVFHTTPPPPPQPPLGYWLSDGHVGTWDEGAGWEHDSYWRDDPVYLFGFTIAQ